MRLSLIFILLFLISCTPKEGEVTAVSDGDTIKMIKDGREVKVRLFGIDAPERGQDYGDRSGKYLSDLVLHQKVKLVSHGRDQYDRLLADVYLNGENINYRMVEKGYAWHFKRYSDDQVLARLEKEARGKETGLWKLKNPTPPWQWRRD